MSVYLTAGKTKEKVDRFPAKLVLVVGFAMLIAACASEPGKDAAAAGASDKSADVATNGEDMQCKYIKVTGTNLPQKFCKTKAMWEAMDKASKSVADEYMRQTNQNATKLENSGGDGNGSSSQRAVFN